MQQKYLIFFGLFFSAFIIGLFLYLNKANELLPAQINYSGINNQTKSSDIKIVKCQAENNTIVTKVIDGDTVVVQGGEHVRLSGIDADEKNYPCYGDAKIGLEKLVLNKPVVLEKDITDVDKYGRCLRTIFIGNENINVELVGLGLAVASFYQPDVKYKTEILSAEKLAMKNKTGCKWQNF